VPLKPAPAIDPAEFEALRVRAEGAERKLREIQTTFLAAKAELDATRVRLERDLARKVEIKFADLVTDLLESADTFDMDALALERDVLDFLGLIQHECRRRGGWLASSVTIGSISCTPTAPVLP
jgi:predicted  nucleic acid-binding Zn-ribbon protein